MNCETVHQRVLGLERPDRLPAEVSAHLARCSACTAWHRRLLRLEREIPTIPAPAPLHLQDFLARLQEQSSPVEAGPIVLPVAVPDRSAPGPRKERGLQKLALAIALAASLLFFAVAWWAWPRRLGTNHNPTAPTEQQVSLLEARLKDDARWKAARTPQERLEVLTHVADEVHVQAHSLIRAGKLEQLKGQARLYRAIIEDGILPQADALKDLASSERTILLQQVARHLAETESAAERLALEVPSAAGPLREIASAARDGDRRLRHLAARS